MRPFVESWLERRSQGPHAELAAEALEQLWSRASRALSRLCLVALMRRALDVAVERSPCLADVRVTPGGFAAESLANVERDEALRALRDLIEEILALLEDTTAAALAPALQAELLRVRGKRGP